MRWRFARVGFVSLIGVGACTLGIAGLGPVPSANNGGGNPSSGPTLEGSPLGDGGAEAASGGDSGASDVHAAPQIRPGIAVGGAHACALSASGFVKCWGFNGDGELGDNTTTDSKVPVAVAGLSSVLSIAAGGSHTCAVTTAGALFCWGWNANGELGNNTTSSSSIPVAVSGLSSDVASVSAGSTHTCAVTIDGAVFCWGTNESGELGNNTTTSSYVPVAVSGLSSAVVAISAGLNHTCALTAAGGVMCWGSNHFGELGDKTNTNSAIPVQVSGLSSSIEAISSGDDAFTCALTTAGDVMCWGANDSGQLGTNDYPQSPTPIPVGKLSPGVRGIAAGGENACAITASGGIACWGNGEYGQLGNKGNGSSFSPVAVTALPSQVIAVANAQYQNCALATDAKVLCWGDNRYGQLGDNSTTDRNAPVEVVGF